jgi:chromosome segregation ATPase
MNDENTDNKAGERRRLETEIFSFEGEKKSLERKKEALQIEVTRCKREIARLESEQNEKEAAMAALDRSIFDADSEISQLKKKMNTL